MLKLTSSTDSGLSFITVSGSSSLVSLCIPTESSSTASSIPNIISSHAPSHLPFQTTHEPDLAIHNKNTGEGESGNGDEERILCTDTGRPAPYNGLVFVPSHSTEVHTTALVKVKAQFTETDENDQCDCWLQALLLFGALLSLCVGAPVALLIALFAQSAELTVTAIQILVLLLFNVLYALVLVGFIQTIKDSSMPPARVRPFLRMFLALIIYVYSIS